MKKQGYWQIVKDEPFVKVVCFLPRENFLTPQEINQLRVTYTDKNNKVVEVSLNHRISMLKAQMMEEDKSLNIERVNHPLVYMLFDEHFTSADFHLVYQRILNIAQFDLQPVNEQQSAWMRCFQFYWYIFAIRLTNLIIPTTPDPVAKDSPLIDVLPEIAARNVIINSNFYFAFYKLLKAGKSRIIQWAEKEGIDYPFEKEGDDVIDLFIHILQMRLKQDWEKSIFSLSPINLSKQAERKMLAQANKFLSDVYLGEPIEKKYEKALREMGWEGYIVLALRRTKHEKLFNRLWKEVIKCNRQFNKIINDSSIYWEDNYPHQTRQTRTLYPIFARIEDGAYIDWHLSKFSN